MARPDTHAHTSAARLAVGSPLGMKPPSQYKPGLDARALPQVKPAPATLAPVALSRTEASDQPTPSPAHALCASAHVRLAWMLA